MAVSQPHAVPDQRAATHASQISNRMVQITREYTGRGPTRARTYIQDDVVLCVMRDALTKGERALADRGEGAEVIHLRRTFQTLMREDATAAIEEITGRRVIGFLSDNATEPDIQAEVFLLESSAAGEDEVVAGQDAAGA
jgi:uncharacterized protein YbcI